MKRINNKGFVMIETIIVMSILALGLISLYTSYVLIIKRTQTKNSGNATNTYIAYQINKYLNDNNLNTYSSNLDTPYYIEIYNLGGNYVKRDCGISNEETVCSASAIISSEEKELYLNLNIEKIYYMTKSIKDIFNDNIILLFDGSTINYLNSIKNDANINNYAERTIIVKTMDDTEKIGFSFYQQETDFDTKNIRRVLLGENNSNVSNATTIPGMAFSDENESVIGTIMDDYGLSYYFRGNVRNNYLVFADKCWRIVRVTGDGSIKLVLYNENSGYCNINGSNFGFARYNGFSYASEFNLNSSYNSYIGYMYSNKANSTDYSESHLNDKDSTILTRLKAWYDNNFTDQEKRLLADVIWCNDKRIVNDTAYNPYNVNSLKATGVKSDATYYQTTKRLNPFTEAVPSALCGGNDNAISKFTSYSNLKNYKIGLLTADEVALAGSTTNSNSTNNSYYLYSNATSNSYWTMSPAYFDGNNAYMWIVNSNGSLTTARVNSSNIAIRPVIALLPTVNIIGAGTSTNPYVVIE